MSALLCRIQYVTHVTQSSPTSSSPNGPRVRPTPSNAPYHVLLSPVLQLPHLPNQQPPTSVLLQFDLQSKPSGMFDLLVSAPHGPPPSSHVTPSWAYSKPPPPLACACSRPTTQTSISSREREKPTPSATN